MPKNLPDLIEDFLRYLKVQRGRTALTVRNYRLYLKRFLNWGAVSRLGQAADLTREKLRDYRLWLTRQKSVGGTTLAASTQNYHLTALRSFVNYLQHKEVETISASSITLSPPQKRKVNFLTDKDRKVLLQIVEQSREPALVKMRDAAIIELIAVSGLKVSELVNLNKSEINLTSCSFQVVRKSTRSNLQLTNEACELLKKYLNARTDQTNFVFIRHDRAADNKPGRLTPRSVQRSLERYRKLAGLKQKITPHTLRHSFAYQLATRGVDLETLQKSLGLKHASTASVYKKTESHKD